MSRSNPTPTNPAVKFFKWSGSQGKLVYWDKAEEKEIEIKLPFEFLVLDQLATITGFCESDSSSYWSNEVRSVAKEEFVVRTSSGTKQTGLYKDLTDVRSKGAKYAKSIYIAFKDGNETVIGNIKAAGAALTSWIDLSNRTMVNNGKITLTKAEEAKKGATTYYTPVFEWSNASTEEDSKAIQLDKELQQYLDTYLSAANFDRANAEESGELSGYEKAKAVRSQMPDTVIDDVGDEPINLDDIPF